MTQIPLVQGEKKIDKYIVYLKQCLGKGSFAEVFMGKNVNTNQQVAVKVIEKKIFSTRYNSKSIQNQIEILKKVEHKNVVKFMDVFQTTNNMYIFTEYCGEGDLQQYLKKRGRLNEKQAIKIIRQLISGYQYLLSIGILHRDLKPANILINNGICKISDFGLAKSFDSQVDTAVMASLVGTPLYMSPQILKKGKYSIKSDVWSIGLIFYELLHGCLPWTSLTQQMLLNNIMTKPVIVDKSFSDKTKDLIKSCLKINQQDRISWDSLFKHMLQVKQNTHQTPLTPTKLLRRKSSSRSPMRSPMRSPTRSPIRRGQRPSLNRTPLKRFQEYPNFYK